MLAGAEKLGLQVRRIALADSKLDQWMCTQPGVWRLRRSVTFIRLLALMWRHRHETLMFDVWLAPLLWPGVALLCGPYFVMVHHLCAELRSNALSRWWLGFCEARLLAGASRILTVSQSSKRQVEAHTAGLIPVGIVNPGFEPVDQVSSGGGEVLRLLFVGHLTRAKGIVDLLRAVAELPQDIPWRLDIVGRDNVEPETTAIVQRIRSQAHLADRVQLHGRLDDAELHALYASSDIFVLPSHWEGYGIVLLEAMSQGMAVVSCNAGAIPEVVHDGKTGLLVPVGDARALHTAIVKLMQDEPFRRKLADNGLAFARAHHDWNGVENQCMVFWRDSFESLGVYL